MGIGENIKNLRIDNNLTQVELGQIAGVSDKAVSTWESGLKEPRMGAIKRIAAHFNLSINELVSDDFMNKTATPEPRDELTEYLELLKTRPECRMLFSLAKDSSKEDVEKAVAIIEAIRRTEGR